MGGYEQDLGRGAARRRDRENGWCILRTNGRQTLRLAQSLNDAGIEAWTPRAVQKRRRSRIHMGFREVEQPIVPSFVFARARYLPDLLAALAAPVSTHPAFSLFMHGGRAPVIGDGDIRSLQDVEQRGKRERRKEQRHQIAIGAELRPTEGPFAGLVGTVEELRGRGAIVNFGGAMRFHIASWLFINDDVDAA